MKTNLIQMSNFLKMSKQKRNQNKQMIIVLPDPKFVKRPDFFSENDQIGDQKEHKLKKTAGQLGARFNACYFGQLTENTKKNES